MTSKIQRQNHINYTKGSVHDLDKRTEHGFEFVDDLPLTKQNMDET